ncbi:MAG: D-alanyl-D-alanine carboxypeptidase/D-alanyl-D-alanine-endopeptidase [Pirellulales bacterium]|nr:D-alanyl-D-alanine carboxypeptidase/D-alanyl-D-alanine-endopeptidase [Pirellulales bacterium]
MSVASRHYVLLIWGALLASFCVRPSAAEGLAEKFQTIVAQPEFRTAQWGLLVADLESGEVLYEYQADKLFAPASTTKLYSVAAALAQFGKDFRFETPLVRRGEVSNDGRLEGDLILIASGDPTLGGRSVESDQIAFTNGDHTYANSSKKTELTAPDPLAGLNALAKQVADAGINHIAGDVLIDDRLFDLDESTGSGPSRLTPIMVNDNVIDVVVSPGEVGKPAFVDWRPKSATFSVDAQAQTVAAGGKLDLDVFFAAPNRILVRGTIPADSKPVVRIVEVTDPATFARILLIEALERAGVNVKARLAAANARDRLPDRDQTAQLPRVALLTSPPLSEEAKLILKVSHNLHASTLPLLLAARHGKRTLEQGLRIQAGVLHELGVDVDTISFGGGAGGARADYITPRATVSLLRHMATRDDFDVYLAALPILGVDGTLAEAVSADSPARGTAQAKTGTLYWRNNLDGGFLLQSKALAGYLTAASGRRLVFALFVNNALLDNADGTGRIGRTLGNVCEKIHESY